MNIQRLIPLIPLCLLLLAGCATQTSPDTVSLATVQARSTRPAISNPKETPVAVGIRFPAGFQSTEAKLLLVEKVNQMMTETDKKGRPRPDPRVSWQCYPEETIYKSLAASLQLREALLSNHVHAFLLPCNLAETNGELFLQPLSLPVQPSVIVDISIVNLLMNAENAPWYKWQGCNMSRYFAPMVAVSIASDSGASVVAGTRRWLTRDSRLAVTLPEVLERRYTAQTYGFFMNYPVVKPAQSGFLARNATRPANTSSFYELDSFVERDKTTADFRAYWNFVAEIVGEVSNGAAANPAAMAQGYAKHLGIAQLPEAKVPLARKFMEAEWKFLVETDSAMVNTLRESKWFDAINEVNKSEDKVLAKAKSKYFWNQFAQVGMALAGGAAAGVGAAAAAQSGTYYNSTPTMMMTMNAMQALGEAGSQEQLAALASYKSVVGKTEESINSVALGLGDEAAGSTIKSIEDIRRIARRHLGLGVTAH